VFVEKLSPLIDDVAHGADGQIQPAAPRPSEESGDIGGFSVQPSNCVPFKLLHATPV
jgi:hypothetical protein